MSIIFFDIDGTIMDLDGTIPPSAVTAVRRLRQAGHHCVINTGRPRLAMDPQLMDMDFDGLVCSCGQYIQLDGKIIRHVGFDRETSRKILKIGRRCRVDMYFEEAERIWCDTPHGIVNRELRGAIARLEARGVRVGQPDGDPDFHFDKVCVLTAPDSLREEFLAEVAPMCQVIDRGNMLELPVRGYSKASGCLAVAQALGEDLAGYRGQAPGADLVKALLHKLRRLVKIELHQKIPAPAQGLKLAAVQQLGQLRGAEHLGPRVDAQRDSLLLQGQPQPGKPRAQGGGAVILRAVSGEIAVGRGDDVRDAGVRRHAGHLQRVLHRGGPIVHPRQNVAVNIHHGGASPSPKAQYAKL